MNIAFIGNGNMTYALGKNWLGDHALFISGRSAQKSADLAARLNARSGTIAEAIEFAEVIVLAVPAEVAEQTMAEHAPQDGYKGKVIIDITNPVSVETFVSTRADRSSVTEALEAVYPKAHFAKAFNMAHAAVWELDEKRFNGKRHATLYSAADEANEVVATLIEQTGCEAVHVGDNKHAYQLEASAAMVIKFLFAGAPTDTVLDFTTR